MSAIDLKQWRATSVTSTYHISGIPMLSNHHSDPYSHNRSGRRIARTRARPQAIVIPPRCTHIATAQPLCAPIGADDSDAVYAEVDVVLAGHELYELHELEWMTGWRVRGPCVM